ncbi:hypothetical protein D3C87_1455560 [compost metagenome]
MPARQIEILARRHFLAVAQLAAQPQQRHGAGQAQCAVEVGPADMDTAVGQDVGLAVELPGAVRRQPHQRKVGGTAADVGHHHQFLARDARFVVERGSNRLVLERDVLEARRAGNLAQRVLGQLVGLGVFVDKEHRPAQHRLGERGAGGLFGAAFQFADEMGQQLAEGHGLAHDLGAVVHHRRAEQALERAHQPALVAGQVVAQRGAPVADQRVLCVEEDHRRQRGLAIFQRQQHRLVGAQPAYRGVGGAEVETASVGHCSAYL